MNEIRYDGPDVEAETGGRVQGVAMVAMMVGEGIQAGRREAHAKAEQATADRVATQTDANRQTWLATPTNEFGELSDEQLAVRWQATAGHPVDPQANRVRGELEKELIQRDPETMRDYRSWRNAGSASPGQAMQMALMEREVRLGLAWRPLAAGQEASLDDRGLPAAWAAALGSHSGEAAAAVTSGETELRRRLPDRMAGYDAAVARGMDPPAAAATELGGHQPAFGPTPTWLHIADQGVPVVGQVSRTAATPVSVSAVSPTARIALAAAQRRGQQP